jgi:4-oxalocrotonate tautomerase
MPHITVKMYAGRSEADKAKLADALAETLMAVLGSPEKAVSVGIEDIDPKDWPEAVYRPEILDKSGTIYKKPGYDPFK